MVIERFEVHLVRLDPTVGAETGKTRPCVIVSPSELNSRLRTVLVAPMTSVLRGWACRVPVHFNGKQGEIGIDQIRVVDKSRLLQKLGALSPQESIFLLQALGEMFAP